MKTDSKPRKVLVEERKDHKGMTVSNGDATRSESIENVTTAGTVKPEKNSVTNFKVTASKGKTTDCNKIIRGCVHKNYRHMGTGNHCQP